VKYVMFFIQLDPRMYLFTAQERHAKIIRDTQGTGISHIFWHTTAHQTRFLRAVFQWLHICRWAFKNMVWC